MRLNLNAPFNTTSYGYVSCFVLQELAKLGYDIHALPISNIMAEHRFGPDIESSVNKPFHYDAPNLKVWHQHSLNQFIGRGPSVALTIFELEQFTETEKHSVGFPDQILVCSEWAKRVVCDQTDRKPETVHVTPLGVDPEIFKPKQSPVTDRTIFLNAGKWELRKGHDVLIEAFRRAFKEDDNVELWMMPHNFFLSPEKSMEWVNFYKRGKLGDKVRIIDRQETQVGVYNIMEAAHCGVFPSRAEGWNLELLELMAMGKQVIATDCTAHTEFCDESNCLPIHVKEKEVAFDGKFFGGHGDWYSMGNEQVEQMAEHMKSVHTQRSNGDLPVSTSGIATGHMLTWGNTAASIHEVLQSV
jgi:glycosyltransferase involved in cell wall biosynthesis